MRALICLAMLCLTLPASAQERVLSAERARGYDTVITQCISFTRAAFANAACDDLLTRLDPMIRAEGLTHIALGRTEWGFGSDVYMQPANHAGTPINLTLYVRGSDAPSAMNIWLSLYKQTPDGRLVLWEDSGLGSGDPAAIANGLSQGLAAKAKPVLETLGAHRKP